MCSVESFPCLIVDACIISNIVESNSMHDSNDRTSQSSRNLHPQRGQAGSAADTSSLGLPSALLLRIVG